MWCMKIMAWLNFCLIPENTTVFLETYILEEEKTDSFFWESKMKRPRMTSFLLTKYFNDQIF